MNTVLKQNKSNSIHNVFDLFNIKKYLDMIVNRVQINMYKDLVLKINSLEKELETIKDSRTINTKLIVAFDMDDTIADFQDAFLKRLNKLKGTNYTSKDITSWDLESIFGKGVLNIIQEDEFFLNLQPKLNMINAMRKLIIEGEYEVVILTACEPSEYLQKIAWVKKYIPELNYKKVIPLTDKYNFNADLLIDDAEHNIIAFPRKKLLVDMNRNKNVKGVNRIYSTDTTDEIVLKIKSELCG